MWAAALLPRNFVGVHQAGPASSASHCWVPCCGHFLPFSCWTFLSGRGLSLPCCSRCGASFLASMLTIQSHLRLIFLSPSLRQGRVPPSTALGSFHDSPLSVSSPSQYFPISIQAISSAQNVCYLHKSRFWSHPLRQNMNSTTSGRHIRCLLGMHLPHKSVLFILYINTNRSIRIR